MKSSEGTRRGGADLVVFALVLAAAIGVGWTQPRIAERFHRLRTTSDVYGLASPDQMVVASLGYRAALADAIFSYTIVSYALHFQEKRRFEFAGDYLDTINALDPKFRDPYRYADTLLVMSPEAPRLEHYVKAREILLRGLENRPFDTELWLMAGQYIAYLAHPYLPEHMQKDWMREGAKILARACELVNDNRNVPYNCITAAALFERVGDREQAIASMQHLFAVTDDPEVEKMSLNYLGAARAERERGVQAFRRKAFSEKWKSDLPFVTKDGMLVVGPRPDLARCAGLGREEDAECVTTWRDWGRVLVPGQ